MRRGSALSDESAPQDQSTGQAISWFNIAGPVALGRSVLLAPRIDVPAPWAHCGRIILNASSLGDPWTLHAVRHVFLTRTPTVFEIDPTMDEPLPGTDQRAVWDVPPNFDLIAEATWRLATSCCSAGARPASRRCGSLPTSAHHRSRRIGQDQSVDRACSPRARRRR